MRLLRVLSWLIEPVVGVVYVLLWVNTAVGSNLPSLVWIVGFGIAITLTRRAPRIAFLILAGTLALQLTGVGRFGATDWAANVGILLVVCFAVAHRHLRLWLPLVLGAGAIVVAAFLMVFQEDGWVSWTSGLFAFGPAPQVSAVVCLALIGWVLLVIVWATTAGSRALSALSTAERVNEVIEDQLANSEVQLALAEERNRIAQEMHDVLAHSLTVVIAQADGARYVRTKRPAAVDASLRSIAESARNALVDVSGIIDGVLDGKPAPQPGLAALESLVSTVTDAGMSVTFTQSGEPRDLAPGQQLAVYRIVQEGLTNALRHRGRTSAATIVFDWRGPGLALQLVSSGGEVDSTPPERGRLGRGIPGMQERARLTGGWATAGLDDNGDHRLTAFIPFRDTPQPDGLPMTAAA